MDTTTMANTAVSIDGTPGTPSACAAQPAQRRSAPTWERSHASTPVPTTGGVRPDASAARLRGGEQGYAVSAPRTTVPSSGTTSTSPPV